MTFDELKEKAHALPLKPGVYIMQDAKNTVIYVARPRREKPGVPVFPRTPPLTRRRPGPWCPRSTTLT